jgi:biopolymer transport protein TolR
MNEINMVPFIDVMLVLLIIFMVTAPLITPSMIDLPSVGKASKQPDKVVHDRHRQGRAVAGGKKVKEQTTKLEGRHGRQSARPPARPTPMAVMVAADKERLPRRWSRSWTPCARPACSASVCRSSKPKP